MTLYEIVNEFLDIARKQPNIGYVNCGDIYSINSIPNLDYSVFFVTQTNHTVNEDTIEYNLTLFYVDRLLPDGSNTLQIQSQSMLVLNNIINIFNQLNPDVSIEGGINFTTFTHRFTDDCGGSFCNVTITTDNEIGTCGYE